MSDGFLQGSISFDLEKLAKTVNLGLPAVTMFFAYLGYQYSFNFHFLSVTFILLTTVNFYYLRMQKDHTLLANFGLLAQFRYMIESIGPEFRQYLFMSDTEEQPFNRIERSEVYRKAKGIDASSAFGSQLPFDGTKLKLRHSMYPLANKEIPPYILVFGEERAAKNLYTIKHPIMIGAMSYGALGENAVRALARGAKAAQIPLNTGEGGYPKYHLMEGCDLIFQLGTAKFGARNDDGTLNDDLMRELSETPAIKMIEIKLSQGAKPGKGGLLPKEKITAEIAQLRKVPTGEDVISPPFHLECGTADATVSFIRRVQEVSGLPVGIKLCLGRDSEFFELVEEMKRQDIYPDYIALDGAEGGTGAAPKSFMDDIGVSIFDALPIVQSILEQLGVRNKLKLIASGKLINPGSQFIAYSLGADAVYTARGFMLAIGCIQAMQCNENNCPVGITTHDPRLQAGLDIEQKSRRVFNYLHSLMEQQTEMLAALGKRSIKELNNENLYQRGKH